MNFSDAGIYEFRMEEIPRWSPKYCHYCKELEDDTESQPWDCGICLRHQSLQSHRRKTTSSQLCSNCAGWDSLPHVLFCQENDYRVYEDYFFAGYGTNSCREPYYSAVDIKIFEMRVKALDYRPVVDLAESTSCILCSQVGQMLHDYIDPAELSGAAVSIGKPSTAEDMSRYRPRSGRDPLQFTPSTHRIVLYVTIRLNSVTTNEPISRFLGLPLILTYRNRHWGLESAAEWDRRYIDISRITSWLADCERSHGERCEPTVNIWPRIPGFHLIDTIQGCVVDADGLERFAALSYVRTLAIPSREPHLQLERANSVELKAPGSLRRQESRLSRVIIGAIRLCFDLKQRYLWVDRLCILHDEPESQRAQISNMDRIYGLAQFTIVGAAGGINSGLPGAPGQPRKQNYLTTACCASRPSFERENHHRFQKPHLRCVSPEWPWSKRSWTFQERLLSRRLIYICEHHTYLACRDDEQDEPRTSVEWYAPERRLRQKRDELGFDDYMTAVRGYTSRQLSFSKDSLIAFAGVGNVLGRGLNTRLLFCLPERQFLRGLLWIQQNEAQLRVGFPSWSWAGWHGQADYSHRTPIFDVYGRQAANLVHFFAHDPVSGLRRVEEERRWFAPDPYLTSLSWGLDTAQASQKLRDNEKAMMDFWEGCIHSPREASARQELDSSSAAYSIAQSRPGCLVFNTTCAWLRVAPQVQVTEDFTLGTLGIYSGAVVVGTIDYSSEYQVTHLLRRDVPFAVLVLGGHDTLSSTWGSPVDAEGCWGLFVMVCEAIDKHLYRRVALGSVNADLWTREVRPRWETVVVV
jgi:hypothetical protein